MSNALSYRNVERLSFTERAKILESDNGLRDQSFSSIQNLTARGCRAMYFFTSHESTASYKLSTLNRSQSEMKSFIVDSCGLGMHGFIDAVNVRMQHLISHSFKLLLR